MLDIVKNDHGYLKPLNYEVHLSADLDQDIVIKFDTTGRNSAKCYFDVEGKGQTIFEGESIYAHSSTSLSEDILQNIEECIAKYDCSFNDEDREDFKTMIYECFRRCDSTYGSGVWDSETNYDSDATIVIKKEW